MKRERGLEVTLGRGFIVTLGGGFTVKFMVILGRVLFCSGSGFRVTLGKGLFCSRSGFMVTFTAGFGEFVIVSNANQKQKNSKYF